MSELDKLPEHWQEPYSYPQPGDECTCRHIPKPILMVGGTSTYEINLECPEHALLYLLGYRTFTVNGE